LKKEIEVEYRKDYFFNIHNEMIKRQLERQHNQLVAEKDQEDVEPMIKH
jgi:hypothetical protein